MTALSPDVVPYRVTLHDDGGWACIVRDKLRCTRCGHRLTVDGVAPVETRRMPPWTWPAELADRRTAQSHHQE